MKAKKDTHNKSINPLTLLEKLLDDPKLKRMYREIPQSNRAVSGQSGRDLIIDGKEVIDFASCNYLGMDCHPYVIESIAPMIKEWGVHPSWTRAVASPEPYIVLEKRLAEFVKAPHCMVFPSIGAMNIAVLPTLAGPEGAILCCSAAHNTIQEACELASLRGTRLTHFEYDNIDDLRGKLEELQDYRPLIVAVDGVYSMTVKYLNLPEYSRLAKKYDAYLYVDDAHGFGVIGESPSDSNPYGLHGNGIVNHHGMKYEEDHIIYISGLSKAFSSHAAFITCYNEGMMSRLRMSSTYVFSGPVPVATLASGLACLEVNQREGASIRNRLFALSKLLTDGARKLGYEVDNNGYFPIIFVVAGGLKKTLAALHTLWERGLLVTPGIFPATPINRCGFRFSMTSLNTEKHVEVALEALEEVKNLKHLL